MKTSLDISDSRFFESLINIEIEGEWYDLHNDYVCVKAVFHLRELQFILSLESITSSNKIDIIFNNIINFEYNFDKSAMTMDDILTIDELGRGTIDYDGVSYFYVLFLEDCKLDVVCKHAFININK